MDSSLLDVSAEIISETPKKKPMSPKSFAKDVVERLAIVTPSGRVDTAEFLSSSIIYIYIYSRTSKNHLHQWYISLASFVLNFSSLRLGRSST